MTTDWGRAKFEVGVLREEILARLADGLTVRAVFNELRTTGRIRIGERSFYRRVKRLRADSGQVSASPPHRSHTNARIPLDGTPTETAPRSETGAPDSAWDVGTVEPVFDDLGPYGGPEAPPSSPHPQSSKESSSHGPD